MKLIKPDVIIKEQEEGLSGIYKQIEWAGRHCYKSLDKITEDSAKAFVDRMIKSGHGAMLEHGTVYLAIPITTYASDTINNYLHNPYSRVNECKEQIFTDKYGDKVSAWCVTTNYRVLIENNCLEDLEFLCEPTEYHEKRITVKWTCDRVTGESFLRHRVFSFARESTRYCNYSKDKFGNEITFVIPSWVDDIPDNTVLNGLGETLDYIWTDLTKTEVRTNVTEYTKIFLYNAISAEQSYLSLIKAGYKPQQARQVLMFSVHSPLVMTGFESDWKHFFSLRSPKYSATGVHPDAAYLADKLYDKIKDKIK